MTTYTARLIDTGAQTAERPWGVYAAANGSEWLDGAFASEAEASAEATRRNAAAEQPKSRTITLTDAPPVRIREDDWPVIAWGSYKDWDNQHYFQANRTWKCSIRVRQHSDGRMIVYGVYEYDTAFQNERNFMTRAGVVLDSSDDPVPAIRQVGETLADAASEAGHEEFRSHISSCVRECIGELPAREL